MKSLELIKYWIFDLDNTLYSGKTKVFEQVDKKMSKFISDKLNVTLVEARKIQKNYFYQYNILSLITSLPFIWTQDNLLETYAWGPILRVGGLMVGLFDTEYCKDSGPYEFRRTIQRLMLQNGWDAFSIDGPGDWGGDIYAERDGVVWVIQSKWKRNGVLGLSKQNGDDVVNIQDIILLINMILSQETNESADVNFDGNVDILDAVVLVNMILQPR